MLRSIVRSSLRFRHLVVAGAAALMFFGVQQLEAMPVDVFPEFAPPRVEIQTSAIGLSAAEVEELVYVRAPIDVIRIDGDRALLSDGPPLGTEVVTVGAAELLGTEYEVGEE